MADPITTTAAVLSLASGIRNLFGRRNSRPSAATAPADIYGQRLDRELLAERGRGERLSDAYERGILSFDPYAAYRTAAQGAFGDFRRQFFDAIRNLRGSQVAAGRLQTGFATEDEDDLFLEMANMLNDRLAQGAMQATAMDLDRLGMIGASGERSRDRVLDAYFGRYATERQAEGQRRAGRLSLIGDIGGALINAAGTYFANRRG